MEFTISVRKEGHFMSSLVSVIGSGRLDVQ